MASDETMTLHSSSIQDQEDDDDDDIDYGCDHHQPYPHNLSRLSMMCTINSTYDDDPDNDDGGIGTFMSRLSIESFEGDGDGDGDADEEFSDEKEGTEIQGVFPWDSDKDGGGGRCYSLPATPPRRRNRGTWGLHQRQIKEYASENEAPKRRRKSTSSSRRRRITRERWLERAAWDHSNYKKLEGYHIHDHQDMTEMNGGNMIINNNTNSYNSSFSGTGESEGGVMVITRPKGGSRSLCMDLEEVKACRDLGFELEHERMLDMMPTRLSMSGSTLDTSSGGNSPISNWRISSPGDDPRDVKARLKVWAQAVALASTSRHCC
ncbi:hypothetical protein F0562_021527 [Nyssa sinensis]|uniref:Uncharacterized protein n=1 Tax=Nyssa sinensis TaxID=561372 RepID=A0A5J5BJL2_9ASTE|nr:hypothetical protein F0562_021527 [Nyssa sinensis]